MLGVTPNEDVATDPAEVWTWIAPVFTSGGTATFSALGVEPASTVPETLPPNVPSNVAVVTESKPVPLIVTALPTGPLAGLSDANDGVTANWLPLTVVPPEAVVTEIRPLAAPFGTVAMSTPFLNENAAGTDGVG